MRTWPTTRLRYVADLNPPVRGDLVAAPDTEVSFLPMEAIGEDGSIRLDRTRPVCEVRTGYTYFEDGDVAFAKVTPCFENGKGALMRDLERGAGFGTSELTVLRPKPGVNARFLNYVVQSEPFRRMGVGAMTGAGGLKRVPDEFTRDFVVAWPNAHVQEQIANFLDEQTARIDALIAEKTNLVHRLGEHWNAILAHEIGAVENRATDSWVPTPLKRVTVARCDGPFGSALASSHYVDEGARVVRLQNIRFGEFDASDSAYIDNAYFTQELSYHSVVEGDVLIAGLGDEKNLVGRACVAPNLGGNALVKADCFRFRLDTTRASPLFVALQLSALAEQDGGRLANGSTRQRIPLTVTEGRQLKLPTLAVQKECEKKLQAQKQAHDSLVEHSRKHIDRLREYRAALISAAVTGQLDINSYKEAA